MTAVTAITAPSGADPAEMIGLAEAAARLGFSYSTIWRLAAKGVLPSIRAGRTFRVPAALIDQARELACTDSLVLEEFAAAWKAEHGWEARDDAA